MQQVLSYKNPENYDLPLTAGSWSLSSVGRYFISLDLVKANFHSLQWVDKALVLGCDTWAELVATFSPYQYLAEAKYFRQVHHSPLPHNTLTRSFRSYLELHTQRGSQSYPYI